MSLVEDKPKTSWRVYEGKHYSIEVVCWVKWVDRDKNEPVYGWNVYLYIMSEHNLYDKDSFLKDQLPWHCGCTYDSKVIEQPFELKYDFQRVTEYKKIGSDYSHLYDDAYETFSPSDGIPASIHCDVLELIKTLED